MKISYIRESTSDIVNGALSAVKQIIITSAPSRDTNLTPEMISFLRQTVTKPSYQLYRGIGLMRDRIPREHWRTINSLKSGDPLPDLLQKEQYSDRYTSFTKKKGVAREYMEGTVELLIEANVPNEKVVCDTTQLEQLLSTIDQTVFERHDFDYFKQDAEVIVVSPIEAKITSKSGFIRIPRSMK